MPLSFLLNKKNEAAGMIPDLQLSCRPKHLSYVILRCPLFQHQIAAFSGC